MSNPLYKDDPDWYERPGEIVRMDYTPDHLRLAMPTLPWMGEHRVCYGCGDLFIPYAPHIRHCVYCRDQMPRRRVRRADDDGSSGANTPAESAPASPNHRS